MRYFLDTEFIEGPQKKFFGSTKPTIDLISIGIVSEDDKEYYAVSKDFNLKEAWNRYNLVERGNFGDPDENPELSKEYWIRENVLKPIFSAWLTLEINNMSNAKKLNLKYPTPYKFEFCYKSFKYLLEKYGKTNQQISVEIKRFCFPNKALNRHNNELYRDSGGSEDKPKDVIDTVEFYGYYSSYDWVVFCWLFGKMNDLPGGFPKFCIDLKPYLDETAISLFSKGLTNLELIKSEWHISNCIKRIKDHENYPKEINAHHSLEDAKWIKKLYKFLKTI